MKAAIYFLIVAIVQGTYGQYDPIIQQIIDAESSIYTSIPSTIEAAMPDFLSSVDSMFDSVMSASLSTANFDLICYLNGQNKYEPWYTNIAYNCIVDRNYTLDNATFWHDAYLAAIPELNQLFVDAKAAVAARPECGPNDQDNFAQSISSNMTYPTYSFQQLLQAISYSYGLVPTEMLYGFSSELSVIFSNAQNDPTYDAIGAIEDAEFRHLQIDGLTVIDSCGHAKWWYVSNIYGYYTTVLDTIRHILVDALLRGSANFQCTGQ